MALFLAINTSGIAVLPLGAIAIRSSLGSSNAAGILVPTVLATACSTLVAILTARVLARRRAFAFDRYEPDATPAQASIADAVPKLAEAEQAVAPHPVAARGRARLALAFGALLAAAAVAAFAGALREAGALDAAKAILNSWMLPLLMAAIVLFGFSRRVKVYESFVQGAREGFDIAVMIIPFLVAILVAVAMFRASGALDALVALVAPITAPIGFPADALPMALIRPLSGSGALAVMTETMETFGPDSFVGYFVSVINGSTETTFYVLAVYFGSVGIRNTRHAIACGLTAELAGFLGAVAVSYLFFG
jgi:spore maturation protein SpmB